MKAIRTELPDGRIKYEYPTGQVNYYTPRAGARYDRYKPDDPRAVSYAKRWFLPLTDRLLPDEQRVMPKTRPDGAGRSHRMLCICDICKDNPYVLGLKQADRGITPESSARGQAALRPRGRRPRDVGTAD